MGTFSLQVSKTRIAKIQKSGICRIVINYFKETLEPVWLRLTAIRLQRELWKP